MLYCRSNILEVLDRALSRMIPHLQNNTKRIFKTTKLARDRTGRISALGLLCTDRAQRGPYCQDLGPIFSQYGPRAWLIIYIYIDQHGLLFWTFYGIMVMEILSLCCVAWAVFPWASKVISFLHYSNCATWLAQKSRANLNGNRKWKYLCLSSANCCVLAALWESMVWGTMQLSQVHTLPHDVLV